LRQPKVLLLSEHEREALVNDVGAVPEEKLVLLRNGMDEVTAHKENDAQRASKNQAPRAMWTCAWWGALRQEEPVEYSARAGRLGVRAVFLGAMNPNHREHGRRFLHEVGHGCQWWAPLLTKNFGLDAAGAGACVGQLV